MLNSSAQNPPRELLKMVKNEYSIDNITIENFKSQSQMPNCIHNIWVVRRVDENLALSFLVEAEGRTETFKYICIIDITGKIKQVRIIEYASNYGRSVTSKNWLKQLCVNNNEELKYGETVDALSGATLSANSIINTLNEVRLFSISLNAGKTL